MVSEVDAFLAKIDAEMRDLSKEDRQLETQEDEVRRRRNELKSRLTDLSRARDVYAEMMGLKARPTRGLFDSGASEVAPEIQVPVRGTVADLSYEIMAARGGRMRVRDVLDELTRIGKLKGGHGDYGTVFGTMSRDSRFVRSGKGEFALAPSAPERPV